MVHLMEVIINEGHVSLHITRTHAHTHKRSNPFVVTGVFDTQGARILPGLQVRVKHPVYDPLAHHVRKRIYNREQKGLSN